MTRKTLIRLAAFLAVVVVGFLAVSGIKGYLSAPQAPAQMWTMTKSPLQVGNSASYDHGKIEVTVATARDFGYRIGSPIYVQMTVTVKPGVQVSLETLDQGVVSSQTTVWQIVQTPTVTSVTHNGVTVYTVEMIVRFWYASTPPPFTAQFLVNTNPNSSNSVWSYESTPPLAVGFTNTAPSGAQSILQGPLNNLPFGSPWKGWLLIALAGLLFLITPAYWVRLWWRRTAPLGPRARALRDYEKIQSDLIKGGKDQEELYKELERIVRKLCAIESRTLPELNNELGEGHSYFQYREQVITIIGLADSVLYGRKSLERSERMQIDRSFMALVAEGDPEPPKAIVVARRRVVALAKPVVVPIVARIVASSFSQAACAKFKWFIHLKAVAWVRTKVPSFVARFVVRPAVAFSHLRAVKFLTRFVLRPVFRFLIRPVIRFIWGGLKRCWWLARMLALGLTWPPRALKKRSVKNRPA